MARTSSMGRTARPALDEQDDGDQHEHPRQHDARMGLEQRVDKAERHRARRRAEAAEGHPHDAVDDAAGAEVAGDNADLAERQARVPAMEEPKAKVTASTRPVRMAATVSSSTTSGKSRNQGRFGDAIGDGIRGAAHPR